MNAPVKARPAVAWRVLRWMVRQAERFFAIVGLGVVVFHLCFSYSRMTSYSMKPTLQGTNWENGDRVVTEKVSYWLRCPRRWEVVTYRGQEGNQIMKRVVGLPGEQVQMLRGGRIFIDGRQIEPPAELDFLDYFPFGNLTAGKTVDCGAGYYLLGDYSLDSDDSRFNGPLPPEKLIGRAWLIVGPSGRRGLVR
jgi:signal peptidase I